MTRHLPISLWRMWAIIVLLPCLCMAALGVATEAAHAADLHDHPGHRLIVFQCDAQDHGIRANCEQFIIAANPRLTDLGEATATHRYEVEVCDLSRSGNANNCDVSFVPKGDQIIAPYGGQH